MILGKAPVAWERLSWRRRLTPIHATEVNSLKELVLKQVVAWSHATVLTPSGLSMVSFG